MSGSEQARRVVVGIDGSRGGRIAAARAIELFGGDATIVLVNVLPADAFKPEQRAQERKLARALAVAQQAGASAETVARMGDAATELVAVADEVGADAIVIGTRGARVYIPGRGDEHELGSVCRAVLAHKSCDVLVTHDAFRYEDKPGDDR